MSYDFEVKAIATLYGYVINEVNENGGLNG